MTFSPATIASTDSRQAAQALREMSAEAQEHLAAYLAQGMRGHPDELQLRQVSHFMKADLKFGALLAVKLAQA